MRQLAEIARTTTITPVDELFQVNIHSGMNETFTLHELCSTNTTIIELKQLIMKQKSLSDINIFQLKYNNELMDNTKTLSDYNITDNRHLIQMLFIVQESSKAHEAPVPITIINNETQIDIEYEKELNEYKKHTKKTESKPKFKITDKHIIILKILYLFLLFITDICALFIGYLDKSECSNESINETTATKWLRQCAWVYIIIGFISFFALQWARNSDYSNCICFLYIIGFVYGVNGIKIYKSTDVNCNHTPSYIMILCWSIYKITIHGLCTIAIIGLLMAHLLKRFCNRI